MVRLVPVHRALLVAEHLGSIANLSTISLGHLCTRDQGSAVRHGDPEAGTLRRPDPSIHRAPAAQCRALVRLQHAPLPPDLAPEVTRTTMTAARTQAYRRPRVVPSRSMPGRASGGAPVCPVAGVPRRPVQPLDLFVQHLAPPPRSPSGITFLTMQFHPASSVLSASRVCFPVVEAYHSAAPHPSVLLARRRYKLWHSLHWWPPSSHGSVLCSSHSTLPEVGGHFKFQLNLGHPLDCRQR